MEQEKAISSIINWMEEKKAVHIKHIDVTGKTDFTDHLIICSGTADLHNKAIAENIIQNAKKNGMEIISTEGKNSSTWILVDFGDIIVHIFSQDKREYYKLEDLYTIGSRIEKETKE